MHAYARASSLLLHAGSCCEREGEVRERQMLAGSTSRLWDREKEILSHERSPSERPREASEAITRASALIYWMMRSEHAELGITPRPTPARRIIHRTGIYRTCDLVAHVPRWLYDRCSLAGGPRGETCNPSFPVNQTGCARHNTKLNSRTITRKRVSVFDHGDTRGTLWKELKFSASSSTCCFVKLILI